MKSSFFILFTTFCLAFYNQVAGQPANEKWKKTGVVELSDSLTSYSQSDIFQFKNLNKVPFYSDAKKLRKIKQLQTNTTSDSVKAKQNEKELYATLKNYVKNFGVTNFYRNTEMLWQLAKLSEQHGPPGEAILLYKLVLKHHRKNIDVAKAREEFDSLTKNQRDYFVALDDYYRMVEYRKEIDTLRPPQGVLLAMASWVNSVKADYGPSVARHDSILLFTSKRNKHQQSLEYSYDEDIFFTKKEYGQWGEAMELRRINSRFNEGSACLSSDGKKLYFARCNSPDSHGSCDVFVSELQKDSTWGKGHNLGTHVNTTSWDSHPSLSHSGDTLFFSSDRLGGFGLADIYYTVKDKKGKWQKAKNLGPVVNTRGNEVSPFFHQRFNVLYFSSNGHPLTFGDFDIYKSYFKNSTWLEPKNIGPLVNGPGSEYYFTIDYHAQHLYYARSEEEDIKNLDLFSFPVPMEAQPEAVATLKGSLVDSLTQQPFKGIVSIIDLENGIEVSPKYLRPDGSFDFQLINKRTYLLIIQGEDFFRIEEIIFMDGDTEVNRQTRPIESKIAFKSLEFEPGKADILSSMHEDLNKLGNFLTDHPTFSLEISGHTDSQGAEDANLKLSQARADAIKAFLIYQFKIDTSRIEAHGYGSSKPIIEEEHEDHRQLNRRVEFEIRKPSGGQ